MAKPRHCISSSCELPLFARVTYCPFCGNRQQKEILPVSIIDVPVVDVPRESVTESVPDVIPVTALVNTVTPAAVTNPDAVRARLRSRNLKSWLAACVAFLAVGAAALVFYTSAAAAQCDSPSRNVLVVLDFSGQRSLTTGEIVNRIQTLFDKTRSGELFALFDTRADSPIFESCIASLSLSTRADVRSQLTETILHAIITAESPRSESLPDLVQSTRQKISQKITDLSLTNYMRASENSVHVVSDLLEGNPDLFDTLCEPGGRAAENFRVTRRGGMEQAVFLNTHVHLHLVPRQDINVRRLNCRDKYWRWLLANTSGTGAGVTIEYLPSSIRSNNE